MPGLIVHMQKNYLEFKIKTLGSALAAAASQEMVMLQTQVVSLLPSRGWQVQGQDADTFSVW